MSGLWLMCLGFEDETEDALISLAEAAKSRDEHFLPGRSQILIGTIELVPAILESTKTSLVAQHLRAHARDTGSYREEDVFGGRPLLPELRCLHGSDTPNPKSLTTHHAR